MAWMLFSLVKEKRLRRSPSWSAQLFKSLHPLDRQSRFPMI